MMKRLGPVLSTVTTRRFSPRLLAGLPSPPRGNLALAAPRLFSRLAADSVPAQQAATAGSASVLPELPAIADDPLQVDVDSKYQKYAEMVNDAGVVEFSSKLQRTKVSVWLQTMPVVPPRDGSA